MDDTDASSFAERLLPPGTARRRAARVGAQVARDGKDYATRLRALWSAARDTATPHGTDYPTWFAAHRATDEDLSHQRSWATAHPGAVAILVVVDGSGAGGREAVGSRPALVETLASLVAQSYGNWRAVCVGAAPALRDPRVTTAESAAAATTDDAGLDPLVLFAVAGDTFEPDALFHLAARTWDDPALELLTWDDDVRAAVGEGYEDPRVRPCWSPDAPLGRDCIGRAMAVRHHLLERAVGSPAPEPELGDGRWWDLVLRLPVDPARTGTVPRVLLHLARRPVPRAADATAFVQAHLDRVGLPATASVDHETVRLDWELDEWPLASILVPTRHNRALLEPCLAALARSDYPAFEVVVVDNGARTPENEQWYAELADRLDLDLQVDWWTEPFNYSRVNNAAAALANGEVLVFLNDDTEALDARWLRELVGWATRPDVGLVGAHLFAPDGTLQHAGVVVGLGGYADHLFEGLGRDDHTVFGPVRTYRNFLAVTCAVAAMARDTFSALGGFDERFVLCGSDVKLGLDATNRGWRTVCTPFAPVAHKESATRGTAVPEADFFTSWWPYQRWLRAGDPFFSPNLSYWSRTPRFRAVDEPSPLERVGEIIHRPLAPKKSTVEWDEAAHTRWLVARCTADDAVIDAVGLLHARHRGPHPPQSMSWWLPDLESPFYGGINTALRLADHLRRTHGVESSFVIAADKNEPFVRSAIRAAFPALAEAPITFIDDPADVHRAPEVDVAVATLWETAYLVARSPGARRKAYLVQDYEPGFYPAGTKAALAEESYRLGLYAICNTPRVRQVYDDRFGGPATSFWPAVDRSIFHAEGRRPVDHPVGGPGGEPVTVFVYARPGHARNCWELAAPALAALKDRFGADVRIVTAGSWATPDDLGAGIEHLGFLDHETTGELYRRCDLGLTLQVSEHPSYLPLELLACGVPLVAFDHPAGDWLLHHDHNSVRSLRTRDALTDALVLLASDPALRARLGHNGAAEVAERFGDWDGALAGIYEFLTDPEAGARPHA